MNKFRFVDLFCGGGGSITGAINALRAAGESYEGRGFNHWETAIKTIQANHPEIVPDFDRACAPIESILPDEIFQDDPTRIDVLWASPSCTHHSVAAGGKPRSNQLRSQPEYLLPYLRLTRCRRMFVENVKELRNWGPILEEDIKHKGKLYRAGSADPRKKGVFFNLWYREIKASGYNVEMEVLNAADYGAATSRERLIVQAVRKSSGEKIYWPEPTHEKEPEIRLFENMAQPWRSAAEIIDWSIPGESIFDRKKATLYKHAPADRSGNPQILGRMGRAVSDRTAWNVKTCNQFDCDSAFPAIADADSGRRTCGADSAVFMPQQH